MDRNLDKYIDTIDMDKIKTDDAFTSSVIQKSKRKIYMYKKVRLVKNIAAAFLLLLFLSAFVPGTPVNALCKAVFSFIPGVGVVKTEENGSFIKVLKDPVTVEDGPEYVTVESAFTQGDKMTVYIRTNVGMTDAASLSDKELLKFYAVEINPKLFLMHEETKISSQGSVMTGAQEDGTYRLRAHYQLPKELTGKNQYKLLLEGFENELVIELSEAVTGSEQELPGDFAVLGEIQLFAHMERKEDVVCVQISAIAPNDLKHLYFETFDHEKESFPGSLRLTDSKGNVYLTDQELNKKNHAAGNTFYFRVPKESDSLVLIIPHVMYQRSVAKEIEFKLPGFNQVIELNKELTIGDNTIRVKSVELLPKDSDLIPEDFKGHGSLKIEFEAKRSIDGQELVKRVMPTLSVKKGLLGEYQSVGQAVYGEVWSKEEQSGFVICSLDDLTEFKYLSMSLDVECIIISEVVLQPE